MGTINHAAVIAADPVDVWHLLRQFGAIHKWHPDVKSCVIQGGRVSGDGGSVRTLQLFSGEEVHERLLSIDNNLMTMTYGLSGERFSVDNFSAGLQVTPVADGMHSFIAWKACFEARDQTKGAEYESVIGEFILNGIKGLAEHLGAMVELVAATQTQLTFRECAST